MASKSIATIIITTRNRPQILQNMLNETRKQIGYDNFEIIVADDCSNINMNKELECLFPEVKFINFFMHQGLIKLRNDLFKQAAADFVFFLDDDSWFEKENSIVSAIKIFKKYPNAGILNFRVILSGGIRLADTNLEKGEKPCKIGRFIGCAHSIRKSFFEDGDIYDGDYFRQGEERDLSIKCLDKGYDILQVNSIAVYHQQTDLNRDHQFIHGHAFRNELFFYLKYFPVFLSPIFITKCVLSHTYFCLRRQWIKAYFFGLKEFYMKFFKFLQKRKPVKFRTVKNYICLNRRKEKEYA